MNFSICSFSYHRAVLGGHQSLEGYLQASRNAGATHLHFWIPHLLHQPDLEAMRQWNWRPGTPDIPDFLFPPNDAEWLASVREQVEACGMPIEMIAMEKAFMQVDDPADQARHHDYLRGWLTVARTIGAPAMRVDPGGSATGYTGDQMEAAIRGYREWSRIAREEYGVRLFVENHWGMSQDIRFLQRLLAEVPEVGFLLDSWNWPGQREVAWRQMAPAASAVHVKPRRFDAHGNEATYDLSTFIRLLQEEGYAGVWGIESVPETAEEELQAVVSTRKLIERETSTNPLTRIPGPAPTSP